MIHSLVLRQEEHVRRDPGILGNGERVRTAHSQLEGGGHPSHQVWSLLLYIHNYVPHADCMLCTAWFPHIPRPCLMRLTMKWTCPILSRAWMVSWPVYERSPEENRVRMASSLPVRLCGFYSA